MTNPQTLDIAHWCSPVGYGCTQGITGSASFIEGNPNEYACQVFVLGMKHTKPCYGRVLAGGEWAWSISSTGSDEVGAAFLDVTIDESC